MRLLFIYSCLPLGGIETFIVRLVKKLHEKNIKVSVLFFSHKFDPKLLEELEQYVTIHHWDDYVYIPRFFKNRLPILKLLFPLKLYKIKNELLNDISHIHAPDTYSILFGGRITHKFKNIPITTGVYHINEYHVKRFKNTFFGRKIIAIIDKLPAQNTLFFNEISKSFYDTEYAGKFTNSFLAPIGVDLEKYEGKLSGNQNTRIVSIGRLTAWKTYNFHMIEIIKKMNEQGVFLSYESYGDGEQKEHLEELVKKENLQSQIFFHPGIPYHLFKETINNSLMFIGAGTAIIEASACGIPSLIGIENESQAISYGFLHDTNAYSYQEKELDYPSENIEKYIFKLLKQTPIEYQNECQMARKRASDFSMQTSANIFSKMLLESKQWKLNGSWISNLFFVISLIIHLLCSKVKGTYQISFFRRL